MVSIASRVTSSLCPWRARRTPRRRIAAGVTTTRKTRRLARKTRRFDRLGSSRRRSRVRPRESRARRSRHATFTTTMRLVDRTCRANRWDRCSGTSVAVAGRRKIGKIRRRAVGGFGTPGDASDAGSASGVGMDPGLDLGAGGSRGRGRRPRVVARRRRRRRRRRRTSGCEKCACASNNAEGDVPIQRGAEKVLTKTKHAIRRIEHAARKVGCVIVRSYSRAPADSTSSNPSTTVRSASNHGVVCRILTTRVFLSSSSDVLARHPLASSLSCSSVSVSSCPVSSRFRARKSFRPRRTPPAPPGPQRSRIRSSSSRRRRCAQCPARRWRRRHRVTSDPPRGGRR